MNRNVYVYVNVCMNARIFAINFITIKHYPKKARKKQIQPTQKNDEQKLKFQIK